MKYTRKHETESVNTNRKHIFWLSEADITVCHAFPGDLDFVSQWGYMLWSRTRTNLVMHTHYERIAVVSSGNRMLHIRRMAAT